MAKKPTEITIKLDITLSIQFLSDVLCTAIETGYEWFAWSDLKVEDDPEMKNATRYKSAKCHEADDDGNYLQEFSVDRDTVAEGIRKLLSGDVGVNGDCRGDIFTAVREQDAGQIDMNLADLILQAALLDEIRYG